MSDEINVLFDVVDRLDTLSIEYMITGLFALAIYATPRMTRDVDIVINVTADKASAIHAAFEADYYLEEEAIRRSILHNRMFNLINQRSVLKVDFIIRKHDEYRLVEFARRRKISVQGKNVWVVSPEDLVLSKLFWAKASESELQLRDVKLLLNSRNDLDTHYIQEWATRLDVTHLLKKASAT